MKKIDHIHEPHITVDLNLTALRDIGLRLLEMDGQTFELPSTLRLVLAVGGDQGYPWRMSHDDLIEWAARVGVPTASVEAAVTDACEAFNIGLVKARAFARE